MSFITLGHNCVCVGASDGSALLDLDGLTSAEALAFLYRLRLDNAKDKPVFVGYDFAVDLELLFHDLSAAQKDVFFGIIAAKEEQVKDTPLYEKPEITINHAGFALSYFAGKILRIAGRGARNPLLLYDVQGYFESCDLPQAARDYLGEDIERVEKDVLPLLRAAQAQRIMDRAIKQAECTARLADRVRDAIVPLGITPRAWYGPSAIAGTCLNKWGARKQSRRLSEGNSPQELVVAIDRAYFGGRVEAIKLGTIQDVRVFDLNSAYAYAITLLSQFYSPLRFTRQYDPQSPFSLWLVDYELPGKAHSVLKDGILGILPTRTTAHGGIYFGLRGRGYFWQPEVNYLAWRYPGCFEIRRGYHTPEYRQVSFAGDVKQMYIYRQELKAKGDKSEKIIKLALSNLYGKFAQNKGVAYYQCRAWAGWITSFVRRLMLEAVCGIEDRVISFNQDAVHVTGTDCVVEIGTALGSWKRHHYAEGIYVAPGIYNLTEKAGAVKQASRGSNLQLDFAKIATDLSRQQVAQLSRQFFVGWQMARANPIRYEREYLSEVVESLDLIPSNLKARNYETMFSWASENRDSAISRRFSGLLSARYIPQEHSGALRLKLKDAGWS